MSRSSFFDWPHSSAYVQSMYKHLLAKDPELASQFYSILQEYPDDRPAARRRAYSRQRLFERAVGTENLNRFADSTIGIVGIPNTPLGSLQYRLYPYWGDEADREKVVQAPQNKLGNLYDAVIFYSPTPQNATTPRGQMSWLTGIRAESPRKANLIETLIRMALWGAALYFIGDQSAWRILFMAVAANAGFSLLHALGRDRTSASFWRRYIFGGRVTYGDDTQKLYGWKNGLALMAAGMLFSIPFILAHTLFLVGMTLLIPILLYVGIALLLLAPLFDHLIHNSFWNDWLTRQIPGFVKGMINGADKETLPEQARFQVRAGELDTVLNMTVQDVWHLSASGVQDPSMSNFSSGIHRLLQNHPFLTDLSIAHENEGFRFDYLAYEVLSHDFEEVSRSTRTPHKPTDDQLRLILNAFQFHYLALLAMRVWDGGTENIAQNRETIERLLAKLQSGENHRFVNRPAALYTFPISAAMDNEEKYMEVNRKIRELYPEEFPSFFSSELGRHLRSLISPLRTFNDSARVKQSHIVSLGNGLDYSLEVENLFPLLTEYNALKEIQAPNATQKIRMERLIWSLADGLSGHPEVLLDLDALRKLSIEEYRRIYKDIIGADQLEEAVKDRVYPVDLPNDIMNRYFQMVQKARGHLADQLESLAAQDFDTFYSPLGRQDLFGYELFVAMLKERLLGPAESRDFLYDDLYEPGGNSAKLSWVRRLEGSHDYSAQRAKAEADHLVNALRNPLSNRGGSEIRESWFYTVFVAAFVGSRLMPRVLLGGAAADASRRSFLPPRPCWFSLPCISRSLGFGFHNTRE